MLYFYFIKRFIEKVVSDFLIERSLLCIRFTHILQTVTFIINIYN